MAYGRQITAYGLWLMSFSFWLMTFGLWLMAYALCLIPYTNNILPCKMAYGRQITGYGLWLMTFSLWLMAYGLYLMPYALTYSIGQAIRKHHALSLLIVHSARQSLGYHQAHEKITSNVEIFLALLLILDWDRALNIPWLSTVLRNDVLKRRGCRRYTAKVAYILNHVQL